MSIERALALMRIELHCVERNKNGCDRDCARCELVQDTQELITAYKRIISYIESTNKFNND